MKIFLHLRDLRFGLSIMPYVDSLCINASSGPICLICIESLGIHCKVGSHEHMLRDRRMFVDETLDFLGFYLLG